ncbi:T9SS type A sorting domain-containing protein [Dyadobacter pollutisoli]|uniref:T9SS type A sorting domain-containing protein n=1 Tax=Dyadobacter pollutisoli TaxID=2910158 RepID=A0A9E8ND66_9BACT|nr:T9SS type A sorting domain-containing protein [Dyadobacter pollutisoli]WAC14545.1 T9SS type A sorting domain-containing protein [Dyadobacter pollutisoli]
MERNSSTPVVLSAFVAQKSGRETILKWTTTFETNSSHFELQHSTDEREWVALRKIYTTGESSSTRNYTFTDQYPALGENFYRLKIVYKDESFHYSRMLAVHFEIGMETVIYPNPTLEKVRIKVKDWGMIKNIEIFTPSGELMGNMQNLTAIEPLIKEFHFGEQPAGTYMIKTTRYDGEVTIMKVLKK